MEEQQKSKQRRPKEITFNAIVSDVKERWVVLVFPQKPKGSAKSPFLGLVYGAIKNVKESFEVGEYDFPIKHPFKEWDRLKITISTIKSEYMQNVTKNSIMFPIVVRQAGENWVSGIFPLNEEESATDDFSYDFPVNHPFLPYDELEVVITK